MAVGKSIRQRHKRKQVIKATTILVRVFDGAARLQQVSKQRMSFPYIGKSRDRANLQLLDCSYHSWGTW